MSKQEENYQLQIEGFTAEGAGVARLDGLAVFVPGALPGEVVNVRLIHRRSNFAISQLIECLSPSPARCIPLCPHYHHCGGCLLQHASYEEQLRLKRTIVSDALKRIAKIDDIVVAKTLGAHNCFAYRNRVSYHVRWCEKKAQLGFYSPKSRDFIAAADCPLAVPQITTLAEQLPDILTKYGGQLATLREVVIRSNSAGDSLLLTMVGDRPLPAASAVAADAGKAEPLLHSVWECSGKPVFSIYGDQWRLVAGEPVLPEQLCGVKMELSPATFTQVNPEQTAVLYQQIAAAAGLTGNETVLDLYSGAGAIALYLAGQAAAVTGIESYLPAVDDAQRNAALNGIKNCRFICGEAEKVLPSLAADGMSADLAVLDPPRCGCNKEVLAVLLSITPARIVYVSCDPATLARDLRILCAEAYQVASVQPIDMFPQTGHVETIVLLSKLKSSKHMKLD